MNPAEFLGEFQAEASEKLEVIAAELLRLEKNAADLRPVREMFLAAHTIKGGAAMLRLTDVEGLAHALEDLLSLLREQRRTLDGATADLLFQTIDQLRGLVDGASAEAMGAEPDARVAAWAARLRASSNVVEPARPLALVVDDSATVRELHTLLLEEAGFRVEAIDDGQAALARVNAGAPYALVVSGLETRGLSGFELAAALRGLPVLLCSTEVDAERRRQALEAGARALLRKGSLEDQDLLDAVRALQLQPAA